MRDGGEGNEGSAAMSGGGTCVDSGGISERSCCRLPGNFRELFEDL